MSSIGSVWISAGMAHWYGPYIVHARGSILSAFWMNYCAVLVNHESEINPQVSIEGGSLKLQVR